jgi:hypothetical protein
LNEGDWIIGSEGLRLMTSELLNWTNKMQSDKRLTSLDEAATKQAVVLRVLGLLGWDPFDVSEIYPEYTVAGKRVDYALRHRKNNKAFIEVKKVSENLERHQEQLLNYSFQEGVKLAILTNGIAWWFYLPLNEGSWGQRKFYTIEIYDQDADEISQKFDDFLSKENVVSGKALDNAEKVYSSRKKQNLIKGALPKAWDKLVNEPDENLIELVAETTEKLCGYRPQDSAVEKFLASQTQRPETVLDMIKKQDPQARPGASQRYRKGFYGYTGKSILSFTFRGKKHEARSWKDMLIRLCNIFATPEARFDRVLTLVGRNRPYFSRNPDELRQPENIEGTSIFAETNLSTGLIVKISKNMVSLFGHSGEDLVIETR